MDHRIICSLLTTCHNHLNVPFVLDITYRRNIELRHCVLIVSLLVSSLVCPVSLYVTRVLMFHNCKSRQIFIVLTFANYQLHDLILVHGSQIDSDLVRFPFLLGFSPDRRWLKNRPRMPGWRNLRVSRLHQVSVE